MEINEKENEEQDQNENKKKGSMKEENDEEDETENKDVNQLRKKQLKLTKLAELKYTRLKQMIHKTCYDFLINKIWYESHYHFDEKEEKECYNYNCNKINNAEFFDENAETLTIENIKKYLSNFINKRYKNTIFALLNKTQKKERLKMLDNDLRLKMFFILMKEKLNDNNEDKTDYLIFLEWSKTYAFGSIILKYDQKVSEYRKKENSKIKIELCKEYKNLQKLIYTKANRLHLESKLNNTIPDIRTELDENNNNQNMAKVIIKNKQPFFINFYNLFDKKNENRYRHNLPLEDLKIYRAKKCNNNKCKICYSLADFIDVNEYRMTMRRFKIKQREYKNQYDRLVKTKNKLEKKQNKKRERNFIEIENDNYLKINEYMLTSSDEQNIRNAINQIDECSYITTENKNNDDTNNYKNKNNNKENEDQNNNEYKDEPPCKKRKTNNDNQNKNKNINNNNEENDNQTNNKFKNKNNRDSIGSNNSHYMEKFEQAERDADKQREWEIKELKWTKKQQCLNKTMTISNSYNDEVLLEIYKQKEPDKIDELIKMQIDHELIYVSKPLSIGLSKNKSPNKIIPIKNKKSKNIQFKPPRKLTEEELNERKRTIIKKGITNEISTSELSESIGNLKRKSVNSRRKRRKSTLDMRSRKLIEINNDTIQNTEHYRILDMVKDKEKNGFIIEYLNYYLEEKLPKHATDNSNFEIMNKDPVKIDRIEKVTRLYENDILHGNLPSFIDLPMSELVLNELKKEVKSNREKRNNRIINNQTAIDALNTKLLQKVNKINKITYTNPNIEYRQLNKNQKDLINGDNHIKIHLTKTRGIKAKLAEISFNLETINVTQGKWNHNFRGEKEKKKKGREVFINMDIRVKDTHKDDDVYKAYILILGLTW